MRSSENHEDSTLREGIILFKSLVGMHVTELERLINTLFPDRYHPIGEAGTWLNLSKMSMSGMITIMWFDKQISLFFNKDGKLYRV